MLSLVKIHPKKPQHFAYHTQHEDDAEESVGKGGEGWRGVLGLLKCLLEQLVIDVAMCRLYRWWYIFSFLLLCSVT